MIFCVSCDIIIVIVIAIAIAVIVVIVIISTSISTYSICVNIISDFCSGRVQTPLPQLNSSHNSLASPIQVGAFRRRKS